MPDHPEPVPSKPNRTDTFIIGTRGSQLATTQSGLIRDLLAELHGGDGLEVILETIRTSGDVNRASLSEIGGQGLFTAEIERALLDGRIDLAVHSLKDLPTQIPADLQLVATPERADVRDVLVTREPVSGIDDLARGAQLGTGSPRRVAQLMSVRPDLRFADIRGNVDTRLARVKEGDLDGVVLAAAGLHRLSLQDEISAYLDTEQVLPAPGQGALGLQMRRDDPRLGLVEPLNHAATWAGVEAERSLLDALGGGCRTPIAAWGRLVGNRLHLEAAVALPDGSRLCRAALWGDPGAAAALGSDLAAELRRQGADEILALNTPAS
jgi:hydroxymethylbilane synthase